MSLAQRLLNDKELDLAKHLNVILMDNSYNSGSFICDIIPAYWETVGDRQRTIDPDGIYRPLYYVHQYGGLRDFHNHTRTFMANLSGHLEGCLLQLTPSPPKFRTPHKPYGGLVKELSESGILLNDLATDLWQFNQAINVPSKHFNAYHPTQWLDVRTFGVEEASCAFVLTRHLSIQLFDLLSSRGVALPHQWPPFKDGWLTWSPSID
ncbi:MAG: hypothetical protein A4E32_00506 [Methanomassiliicoccales archaeon PtaU1.Bin124]|nr:MAG: hypothetical protein A4E32_00506 [Methanomassiliicoccales archaeon PtaU1.Bin124]